MVKRELIRSFVCIEIPVEIKERIENFLSGVKALDRGIKWVERENLHVTIKFLGEEPHTKVEKMIKVLKDGVSELGIRSFPLFVHGIGTFPDWNRPRVIWVGLEGSGIEELRRVHDFVEREARRLDFERDDKPFSPHVTLGRVKVGRITLELKKELENNRDLAFGSFLVQRLILMRSQLFPQGPVYTPLAIIDLEGG